MNAEQQWVQQREGDVLAVSDPTNADDDCPAWLQDDVPAEYQRFVARRGLPEPFHSGTKPLGLRTRGIDRWQANHFLVHNAQTQDFIERDYTSPRIEYVPGTLPEYEKVAARYGGQPMAFLTHALPTHPTIPPIGPMCPTNRGLDDEALLRSGVGFCNEQARVFVRLCQVSGIPARLIFLFYADRKTGHTTAEYWHEGRWIFVDVSWFIQIAGLSTAACHREENRLLVRKVYVERMRVIAGLSDDELAGAAFHHSPAPTARAAAALRTELLPNRDDKLWVFGVLNYPLPK